MLPVPEGLGGVGHWALGALMETCGQKIDIQRLSSQSSGPQYPSPNAQGRRGPLYRTCTIIDRR